MQLTITVNDPELIAAIKSWEDGSDYSFTVTQDAPMQFTATDAGEVIEEEPEPAAPEPYTPPEEMTQKAPGIARMMAKGKTA